MSAPFPDIVDAWRMVSARRSFDGTLPIAGLPRLAEAVAASTGSVAYEVEFGRDDLETAFLAIRVQARLTLTCQRTLEPFEWPVTIDTRLGLITREEEEAGLPPGYEPLLLESAEIRPADVIEDELLLALPLIPVKPGADEAAVAWSSGPAEEMDSDRPNPFAVLGRLKK
ncbi:YceD family protein [Tahibacter amnicola]|uniref:Large ribosomal RNA subunit accumulation protein YceD n=1 Tax=Tahibacter amnicola TaxID=2976241 RepID=A0ABY6BIF2_9GAMM|nr:YceD family protein [Tahibacter amnicola]UXI69644.1 YceD family protein [Tahibacter amnicola]